MKFVFFAYECYPLPLAKHLVDEGNVVLVGIVRRLSKLNLPGVKDEETIEDRAKRLRVYDGLLYKDSSDNVLEILRKVPRKDKDDYFIFFDYNNMYHIAEKVMAMGFKNGLFPTEYYYNMEKDRALAKNFVKANYPKIKVAESHDFSSVQDGIKFLNETEGAFVLKSNGDHANTKVPKSDDPEKAKKSLIEALTEDKQGYEKGGFLLEEKISNCLEVTPVMVFYDGVPVYSLVEFECKEIGAGNIGMQMGGNLALSVKTPLDCELNKMAFPKAVHDLAKKQPGFAIYDMGLLYNSKDFYFTEFCAMRFGWDGIFSEIVMRDDGQPFVTRYFEDVIAGKNPLINQFGASVRLFNLNGSLDTMYTAEDDVAVEWPEDKEQNLFMYRIKKLKDKIVSVGGYGFLGAATGASNLLETAVAKAYDVVDSVEYDTKYYRPKFDYLSMDYKSSILNRYAAIKKFIE